MKKIQKRIKLSISLKTLTPIHIGCNEVFQPTEFVIDSIKNELLYFSLFDLISILNERERQELEKISEEKNAQALVKLYRFYAERIKDKIQKLPNVKRIKIPYELAKRYEEVLRLNNLNEIIRNFNNFEIKRTYFNPYSEQPIIPGSSLKGAIRTAYLEALLSNQKENIIDINEKERNLNKLAADLEKKLLNYSSADKDPFKNLKISDLTPTGIVNTEIMYEVNIRKSGDKSSRPRLSLPIEVIPAGVYFIGEMDFIYADNNNNKLELHEMNKLELSILLEGLDTHYKPIFEDEMKLAKNLGFQEIKLPDEYQRLSKAKTAFLIKIGKHSGAEAVTIKGVRKIPVKLPGNKKEYRDSPTTIWLASPSKRDISKAYPFGWALLTIQKKKV